MAKTHRIAVAAVAVLLITGCSPKSTAPPARGSNVVLTPQQRQKIRLYTVTLAKYRRNVDTTGVVDFDNDQATAVLAPFSGPVSQLFVQPSDVVRKGQALAAVVSPDFGSHDRFDQFD